MIFNLDDCFWLKELFSFKELSSEAFDIPSYFTALISIDERATWLLFYELRVIEKRWVWSEYVTIRGILLTLKSSNCAKIKSKVNPAERKSRKSKKCSVIFILRDECLCPGKSIVLNVLTNNESVCSEKDLFMRHFRVTDFSVLLITLK